MAIAQMYRSRPPMSRTRKPKRSKEPWHERNSNGMQSTATRSLLTSPIKEVLRHPPALNSLKQQAEMRVPALPIGGATRDQTAYNSRRHNKRNLMAKPTRWLDTISTPIRAASIASSKEQYSKVSLPATLTAV